MDSDILVLNPKRRHRRRKMSALQASYFGGGRRRHRRARRNPVIAANPHRRTYRRASGYVVGSRRIRRRKLNPVGGFLSGPMEILTNALPGTIGIVANNAVGNLVSDMLGMTGNTKRLVKVGTAVLLPTLVGMFLPQFRRVAALAGTVAVAHEAAQFLESQVFPTLGPGAVKIVSSSDGAPVMGYLPGNQYLPQRAVGYLPGAQYTQFQSASVRNPFAVRAGDMAGVY